MNYVVLLNIKQMEILKLIVDIIRKLLNERRVNNELPETKRFEFRWIGISAVNFPCIEHR